MNPLARNLVIGAGVAVTAWFLLFRRSEQERAEDDALGFTEETGALGRLGAATNRASGGILARIGQALGGAAATVREAIVLDDPTQTPPIVGINDPNPPRIEGRFGGF